MPSLDDGGMDDTPPKLDLLESLRTLDRETVEHRLAEIEAERKALITVRRAIVRRDAELNRKSGGHSNG